MQVKENWSRVTGQVEKWIAPTAPGEPGELVVRVDRVAEVKDAGGRPWPNLLETAVGSTLRVHVPVSAAASLDVVDGRTITLDVRRGREPGVAFANPESIRLGKP